MAPRRTSMRVRNSNNEVECLKPTNCGSHIPKGVKRAKPPRSKKNKGGGNNWGVVDLTSSIPIPEAMDLEEIHYPISSSVNHVSSTQKNNVCSATNGNMEAINLGPDDKFIFIDSSDSDDCEPVIAKPIKKTVRNKKAIPASSKRLSLVTKKTNEVLVSRPTESETNEVLVTSTTGNKPKEVLGTNTAEIKQKSACPPKKYNFEESSDSSDSDCEVSEDTMPNRPNYNFQDFDSDEDNTDLYSCNYNAERVEAFQMVEDNLKSSASHKKAKGSLNNLESPTVPVEDDLLCDQSSFMSDSPTKEPPTPSFLNISLVELKGSAKPRRTKKSKQALASLQSFSKRYNADMKATPNSLDSTIDDVVAVSDDECSEVKIKIRWGTSYIKLPIRKDQKFIVLYQQLAEKHNVSVSQVVLSYNDRVIKPETPFLDYNLTVADILDGGIISKQTNLDTATECNNEGEDMIVLKLQSTNKKDSITVNIGKYDKLAILMQNYAESSKVPLDKIKFCFDGDTLKPSDTPLDLDLEGGECIDVFIT